MEQAMNALARALVRTAGFLETADEDAVDPHVAARALEEIGQLLAQVTPDEKAALLAEAAAERAAAEAVRAPAQLVAFYSRFAEAFGLDDE
jgi:hypothetical protein